MKRYLINEVFSSIQGEGVRAGTAATFIRFAKCNLACNQAEHGFDCDTDFEHGDWFTGQQLVDDALERPARWVILTGGEPALQVDEALVHDLQAAGHRVAMETNGTRPVGHLGLDWLTVSPKTPELAQHEADEVKFVLAAGVPLPEQWVKASHYLISPAAKGDTIDPAALAWCVELVTTHPTWRLSCQQHKWWGVR